MQRLSYKTQRYIVLISFLAIPLALLITFSFYPAFNLIVQSFTSWDGLSQDKQWVGISNYKELFGNSELFQVLSHNFAYLVAGLVQSMLALYFAVILNSGMRARKMFRVILFMPYIVNSVAIAYIFSYIYDTEKGALNLVLTHLGFISEPISWLGNASLVNYCLAAIGLWKYMGLNMVLFLGAMQSIPNDLYEAAKIDGANAWQSFWKITMPNILIIIELMLFLTVSGSLEAFDMPFILTKGGPLGASDTFVTKTVDTAFKFNNFGLASAMGVVLLVIVVILVTVQRKFILRKED